MFFPGRLAFDGVLVRGDVCAVSTSRLKNSMVATMHTNMKCLRMSGINERTASKSYDYAETDTQNNIEPTLYFFAKDVAQLYSIKSSR